MQSRKCSGRSVGSARCDGRRLSVSVGAIVWPSRARRLRHRRPALCRRTSNAVTRPSTMKAVVGALVAIVAVTPWLAGTFAAAGGAVGVRLARPSPPVRGPILRVRPYQFASIYARRPSSIPRTPNYPRLGHGRAATRTCSTGGGSRRGRHLAPWPGWSFGRRTGRSLLTFAAAAAVVSCPLLTQFDAAGDERDRMHRVVGGRRRVPCQRERRPSDEWAGCRCGGCPSGSKLTMVVAVAAHDRRDRRRTARPPPGDVGARVVPLSVTGGYWYVRNLIIVGSPVPAV